MIIVNNVSAGYGNIAVKGSKTENCDDVIHNISFKAENGESLCVLGPNGCGKSTLLRSIGRILDYRGSIMLDGQDAASFSRKELAKKIALLGQSTQVFFPYSVYETVSMGRYAWSEGFLKNLSANDEAIIENILKKLDILDISDRMIDELSGGQLQRVFLAKTLAQTPEVILLDEPTNHLDLKYQIELLEFLKSYVHENNKILIGVFHDLNLARRFGDTAIVMQNGSIAAAGSIEETMNSEILQRVYSIDIGAFMRESLAQWQ